MQNQLNSFQFGGNPIRAASRKGDPWFVARDLCGVLGLTNVGEAIASIDLDDKEIVNHGELVRLGIVEADDLATTRLALVTEGGMYALIFKSIKPEAKAFKKWVTSEVLPAIRKNGAFGVKQVSQAEMLLQSAQVLVDHERQIQTLQVQVSEIPTLAAKVDALESIQRESAESLEGIPDPSEDVPDLSVRSLIGRVVKDYAFAKAMAHNFVWRRLNQEYRDRHHIDLMARRAGKQTMLDVADDLGLMESLYAVAHLLFARAS